MQPVKISILCENQVGHTKARELRAEWGLSFFVEHRGHTILFDTGHSDIYLHNAKHMGVHLNSTDALILSHRHWDHVGGAQYFPVKDIPLYTHPLTLEKAQEDHKKELGLFTSINTLTEPKEIFPTIIFLGEIPRISAFEPGKYKGESMEDDTALALVDNDSVVVVTGCSHSGICNITEYARDVTGLPVRAVVGGFHLTSKEEEQLQGTVDFFARSSVENLYPMHCTDTFSICQLAGVKPTKKKSAGDIIEL
jgi:7,8-dihydropterin-6-yl-methyl-4-(beta-D-ribofuranosyl)aminobenzene 5'-phosphate synthase